MKRYGEGKKAGKKVAAAQFNCSLFFSLTTIRGQEEERWSVYGVKDFSRYRMSQPIIDGLCN